MPIAVGVAAFLGVAPHSGLTLAEEPLAREVEVQSEVEVTAGVCPGIGSCCVANESTGCDDAACCNTVCALDSFCCEVEWDVFCVDEAESLCDGLCVGTCAPDCGKLSVECVNPGPRYANRTFVGRLLFDGGPFCTAWIVASDGVDSVVITNAHCVGGDVTLLQVEFNYECDACADGAFKTTSTYGVIGVITQNPALDYALLQVAGDPAADWGVSRIDPRSHVAGLSIYEIHHGGTRAKGYDEGIVTATGVSACVSNESSVDVIASGGASGSPVFRQDNDCATAICNCGPDCAPGFVVPMSNIVPDATPELTAAGFAFTLCSTECLASSPAEDELILVDEVSTKNRVLSFAAGDSGRSQAIRVTFVSLPSPFAGWSGSQLWVGPPSLTSENGASVEPISGFPNFHAAMLQCVPYFTDWTAFDLVHAFHEGIIPEAEYRVEVIDENCNAGSPSSYSDPLDMMTPVWGDTITDFTTVPPAPPNGTVDIIDATAVVGAFVSDLTGIRKARGDLEPACLDLFINITDVIQAVSGFQGLSYAFEPTAADPCDSTCDSPLQ